MTDPDPIEAMRAVARDVLREIVSETLAGARARPNGNGHHAPSAADRDPVPQVPAPPVAAVLRPSTWTGPAVPGEVIGDCVVAREYEPASDPDPGVGIEVVSIDTDEDLERFVRALLARFESPRETRAIRAGRIRFALRRAAGGQKSGSLAEKPEHMAGFSARPVCAPRSTVDTRAPAPAPAPGQVVRIPKGAVTERVVRDAADRGVRLVLARGAVLTPLARDKARALGVEIEKEGRC